MDINVRVTLDASDKLTQMVFAVAAMFVPVSRTADKSSAVPETAPKTEPAPKPYGVYAMAESLASKPDPAPTTAPTTSPAPEPAQNAEQAKALTIDDVRHVCLRATKAGKTKVVMDFLDAQGVKNLPALDPSLYEALVKVVEDNL